MILIFRIFCLFVCTLVCTPPAFAAGDAKPPKKHTWSFEGPFGVFDRKSMQRGFQVYQEVCSGCHGMRQLAFRHMAAEGGPFYLEDYPSPNDNPVIRAISAQYVVEDGPDNYGDMFERSGRPADQFPEPYANAKQAAFVNNGAVPPDLSVITKARHHGPEYVYSLLTGYSDDVPYDVDLRQGQYYNPYMAGKIIAMAPPLMEGLVTYEDGTEATVAQMAEDVVAFLAWAAEPHMEARKRMGFMVMISLFILASLVYAAYRQVWSNVEH